MSRSIVVMSMGGVGHVQVLRPVIAGIRSRGVAVHVMTHSDFRETVVSLGADFIDLFARHPLDAVDATSIPVPSRNVTFAGTYAESLTAQIAELAPGLIVYDTFTVAGPVVARALGIPYVNVCTNHAPVPHRMLAALRQDPRVSISAACWEAVARLRQVHGMSGANPFSYYETVSPYLNVYCEPEEFLDAEDNAAFEPVVFAGALLLPPAQQGTAPPAFPAARRGPRIYVSFGTVIWWYYEKSAREALSAICRTLAPLEVDVLIGLGGHPLAAAARDELAGANIRVADYADQWAALAEADAFVTHHGINSTHESIVHEVPMLSYPFFGDQPALARRCQDFGLAVPLSNAPQAPIEPAALLLGLDRLATDRHQFAARLAEARSWELRTIRSRDAILDRLLALAKADRGAPC